MFLFKYYCCCCRCCCEEEQPIDYFDDFSYRGITQAPDLQYTDTKPYRVENQGIHGVSLLNILRNASNTRLQVGWKFHIAINYRDIEKAWNTIRGIIMDANITETKVIPQEYLARMSPTALGREITIYAFKEEDGMDWRPLIEKIETALAVARVREGLLHRATERIPGCRYFSFRCDMKPIPPCYDYMQAYDFYRDASISIENMYIDADKAYETAGQRSASPANPYNFEPPPFIVALLNASRLEVTGG
jgi:hypothetical protein